LIVALIVPQLLHSILGVNTLLSTAMGIFALIRSTAFWLALFAGAWLALDPIVKCSFISLFISICVQDVKGDDLRGLLASLPREQKRKAQMIAAPASGSNAAIGRVCSSWLAVLTCTFSAAESARARRGRRLNAKQRGGAAQSDAPVTGGKKCDAHLTRNRRRAIYRWHGRRTPEFRPRGLTSY